MLRCDDQIPQPPKPGWTEPKPEETKKEPPQDEEKND